MRRLPIRTGSSINEGETRRRVLLVGLVGVGFVLGTRARAADEEDKGDKPGDDGDKKEDNASKVDGDAHETLAEKAADRFPQPVAVGALLNRRVIQPLESQPTLGTVTSIVRNADKSIAAVIAYGGYFGFGSRLIAVPIDAMALLSPELEIVDFKPSQLDTFPTFDAAGTTPLAPGEIIKVALAKPSH